MLLVFLLLDLGAKPLWPVVGFPLIHIGVWTEFEDVTWEQFYTRRRVEFVLIDDSVSSS